MHGHDFQWFTNDQIITSFSCIFPKSFLIHDSCIMIPLNLNIYPLYLNNGSSFLDSCDSLSLTHIHTNLFVEETSETWKKQEKNTSVVQKQDNRRELQSVALFLFIKEREQA